MVILVFYLVHLALIINDYAILMINMREVRIKDCECFNNLSIIAVCATETTIATTTPGEEGESHISHNVYNTFTRYLHKEQTTVPKTVLLFFCKQK